MNLLLAYFWSFWCYFVLTVIFIIAAPLGVFLSFVFPNLFSLFTFYLAKLVLFLIGVRIVVYGEFPIKSRDPVIYIANHSSYLDPVLNCYLMRKKYKYLAKAEVLSWPVFGFIVRETLIPVKREKKESRSNSIDLMKKNILNGYSIVLYPEGGWKDENSTHPYDIKSNTILNQFRNGAFRLSIDSQTQIVPISLCNANGIHSSDTMLFKPGKVIINIHEAINPKDLSMNEEDISKLNKKCYSIIYKDLIKYDN